MNTSQARNPNMEDAPSAPCPRTTCVLLETACKPFREKRRIAAEQPDADRDPRRARRSDHETPSRPTNRRFPAARSEGPAGQAPEQRQFPGQTPDHGQPREAWPDRPICVKRMRMRILFIGDIIGKPGRDVVAAELPAPARDARRSISSSSMARTWPAVSASRARPRTRCLRVGVDVITTGNHWADQKEILSFIDDEDRVLRPRNYPPGTPGNGANLYQTRNGRARARRQCRWAASSWMRSTIRSRVSMRNSTPVRWARRPMPSSSTCMPKRRRRRWRWAISATAARASSSARIRTYRRPTRRFSRRHGLPDRCRRLRRLRQRHRHGQVRAGAALHHQDVDTAASRPRPARRRCAACSSRPTRKASRPASNRCAWAAD